MDFVCGSLLISFCVSLLVSFVFVETDGHILNVCAFVCVCVCVYKQVKFEKLCMLTTFIIRAKIIYFKSTQKCHASNLL